MVSLSTLPGFLVHLFITSNEMFASVSDVSDVFTVLHVLVVSLLSNNTRLTTSLLHQTTLARPTRPA